MEIRTNILQQISQALNPGLQPSSGINAGQNAGALESDEQGVAIPKLAPLQNAGHAVRSGNGSLLLSSQEKDILEVLFVNQSTASSPSGFSLYGDQPQKAALRGSFVN